MPLLSLSLNNFRNLENKTIDLLSKEVYFVGENGQGKTNLLESLYYLAYGSSFRTHTEQEIVKEKRESVLSLLANHNITLEEHQIDTSKAVLWVSPFTRTRETAELINQSLQIEKSVQVKLDI